MFGGIMLKIKDLKKDQFFYSKDAYGNPYDLKAWGDPFLVDDTWCVMVIHASNFIYTLDESDEVGLYLTKEMKR
jgi:hypothetical protein